MLYIAIDFILLRPRGIPPLPTRRTLVNISSPSALSPSQQPSVIRSSFSHLPSPPLVLRSPIPLHRPASFRRCPGGKRLGRKRPRARSEVLFLSLSLSSCGQSRPLEGWSGRSESFSRSLSLSRSLTLSLKRQAPVHAPALAFALFSLFSPLLSLLSISSLFALSLSFHSLARSEATAPTISGDSTSRFVFIQCPLYYTLSYNTPCDIDKIVDQM
jgi:hypothetical protein